MRPQLTLDLDPAKKERAEKLLAGLNAPQRDAVLSNDGPLLVLAGAGSGKTRALTRKIAWLVDIERYQPWEILAVTFTNKAAGEMRERVGHLLGDKAQALWLGTFHAIGVRLLRMHGQRLGLPRHFVIYDDDDQETVVNRCLQRLGLSDKAFPPRQIRAFIDQQKQLCRGPDHAAIPRGTPFEERQAQLYELYQAALKDAGAVDFNDLIWLPYRLVSEVPEVAQDLRLRWRYVLVDEFQDTNRAQYLLLQALLGKERRLCVVGDDDQSIYRWRGAEVENILRFGEAFPGAKVIRFEQNYRSTKNILAVAGAVIAKNSERHGKILWTENDDGDRILLFTAQSESDEAEWVVSRIRALRHQFSLSEFAIFYRTNAQSRAFEDRLRASGLPYRVYGGLRFYDRAEIKDVIAYLKLLVNPADAVALERIINKPARGIGKGTLEKIEQRAADEKLSLWAATCAEAAAAPQGKLVPFVDLIVGLQAEVAKSSALELTRLVLERTGYLDWLKRDGSVEAETRAENVRELVGAIADFTESKPEGNTIDAFLDEVALVSALDQTDPNAEAVVLMTAHMAKGLEFDVVFVTGMEEDLMPHSNANDDPRQMEEERRLTYVAMTRARRHLHLAWAQSRRRFGQSKLAIRSRFLDGLPAGVVVEDGAPARPRYAGGGSYGGGGGYGGGGYGGYGGGGYGSRREAEPDYTVDAVPSYEDESQDEEGGLARGRRVFHPSFGEGRVESVEGQGEKAKVSVRFADGSTRKLMAFVLTGM
ncbi:MAG: 3'-5' exonuclease [Myxococcota bacterium]